MPENVTIQSGSHRLSGIFDDQGGGMSVIITHPHPLYGGDMNNPVVSAVDHAYRQNGYTTLRFNFRGVGGSEGVYTGGPGEQEDVVSAIAYLRDRGFDKPILAGYSFGAWVNAHIRQTDAATGSTLMVAPPVAFMDFESCASLDNLQWVITGDRDDIAPPSMVESWISKWNPHARLELIYGADHFYNGHLDELVRRISGNIGSTTDPFSENLEGTGEHSADK